MCSFNSRTSHLCCFCWAHALLASPPRRNGPLDQSCSHPQCVGSFQGGLEVPSPGHHSPTTFCLGSNISPAGPGPTATLTSQDPFLTLGLYPESPLPPQGLLPAPKSPAPNFQPSLQYRAASTHSLPSSRRSARPHFWCGSGDPALEEVSPAEEQCG